MVRWKEGTPYLIYSIVENGNKISCMEKVVTAGRMVVNTMENSN